MFFINYIVFTILVILKAFQMFDHAKEGLIETSNVATILETMNLSFDKDGLARTLAEYDANGKPCHAWCASK